MSKRVRVRVQRFKGRPFPLLQWVDPDTGKRKHITLETGDPKLVERARADKEYELNHGLHEEASKMTWKAFREQYEREAAVDRTEKGLHRVITTFNMVEKIITPKTLGSITERTIARITLGMRQRGLAPSTIKSYLAHLKASLRWAVRQRILTKAPHIEMPSIPKNTNKARILKAARITGEEFERLLNACPNRGWELYLMLCWHSGLRKSEARDVRGEHFNLERHTLHLPKNKAKDAAATAVIPPELHDYLVRRYPDGIPEGKLINDRLVPTSEKGIADGFAAIAKASKVPGNSKGGFITLHDMRRNFGSRWATKVPAQILQRMMRHSHISVTLDFYAETEEAAVSMVWGRKPS